MSQSLYGDSQKVTKTLKIEYTEDSITETVNYPIEIINNVKTIAMHDYPKQNYNVNESEDLSQRKHNCYKSIWNTRSYISNR